MNKIKTIKVWNDIADFDAQVNSFGAAHKVFATQTHIIKGDNQLCYVAVIFFKDES